AFGESGIGWVPYALDRMDFEWEDRFTDLGLKMKPSDYWRRQCKATFQFDRIGAKLIDDMGAESLMWGSDYPHGDGVWPNSDKYIKEQFAEVSPEVTRMITCTNAGKFYGLINYPTRLRRGAAAKPSGLAVCVGGSFADAVSPRCVSFGFACDKIAAYS